MSVHLSWLLSKPELGLELAEGDSRALPTIRFVHTTELDDPSPWLKGGELVLTTGLNFARRGAALDEVAQRNYILRLAEAGIAALGFGVGVHFEEIPKTLRHAARNTGLTLLEVPLPTPFLAVTETVAMRLAEQQADSLHRVVRFQQQLAKAALSHGTQGVISVLASELQCSVLLLDEHQREQVSANCQASLVARVQTELGNIPYRGAAVGTTMPDVDGWLDIQSLGTDLTPLGWLAVSSTRKRSLDHRMYLNLATSMLVLQLERPRELSDHVSRLGSTLLEILMNPNIPKSRDLTSQLKFFGFDEGDLISVIVVEGVAPSDDIATPVRTLIKNIGIPHLFNRRHNSKVTILVRANDSNDIASIIGVELADVQNKFISVGVSSALDQPRAALAAKQALRAVESARWRKERINWFDSLGLESILADVHILNRINEMTSSILTVLEENNGSREPSLIRSLEAYLQSNGSWEVAARALHVHRHTLRNRISQVEELTGMRLDVADDRVVFILAIRARNGWCAPS